MPNCWLYSSKKPLVKFLFQRMSILTKMVSNDHKCCADSKNINIMGFIPYIEMCTHFAHLCWHAQSFFGACLRTSHPTHKMLVWYLNDDLFGYALYIKFALLNQVIQGYIRLIFSYMCLVHYLTLESPCEYPESPSGASSCPNWFISVWPLRGKSGHLKATLVLWGTLQVCMNLCFVYFGTKFCFANISAPSHKIGSEFKIYIWISVFRRIKSLEICLLVLEILNKQTF